MSDLIETLFAVLGIIILLTLAWCLFWELIESIYRGW